MSDFDKGGIVGGWVTGRLETWECVINAKGHCMRTDRAHDPENSPDGIAQHLLCRRSERDDQ